MASNNIQNSNLANSNNVIQGLKRFFNSLDTIKLVEKIGDKQNSDIVQTVTTTNDVDQSTQKKPTKIWKQWLHFFSSYNALAVSILVRDLIDANPDEEKKLKAYRILYAKLAYHGLIFKFSRAIFIIGSVLLSSSIIIAMLIAIKKGKNTLDFLTNRKFLLSIAIISLFLFVSLMAVAFWKIGLEYKVNKKDHDVHIKITKAQQRSKKIFRANIIINPENESILNRDNNDDNQQRICKAKFNENYPSNILDTNDNHYHIKDPIPLYKTGYCSKSGSYKFFYFSTILMSLAIGLIALTALYSQKNEKIAELTKNFLQEPNRIGYSILGCMLAFLILYCLIRYGKEIFNGLCKFAKWAVTGIVNLFLNLGKQFWKFLCFCGRALKEIGGKFLIFMIPSNDVDYVSDELETTTLSDPETDKIIFNPQ